MQKKDIIRTLEKASDAPAVPFPLFADWYADAEQAEPSDPNAMCLTTVDPDGHPNARMVLLKGWDETGFVFYTNRKSVKGQELAQHKHVALCFHWKSLTRQVRIRGTVSDVTPAEADAYYATRSRGSRIGAWASQQSQPLETRATLADRVAAFDKEFGETDTIPRPPHWSGFRVTPHSIEFWHDGAHRLHARLLYTRTASGWDRIMLNP